jgi:hypothetical protein
VGVDARENALPVKQERPKNEKKAHQNQKRRGNKKMLNK